MRILVVDDDVSVRETLAELLHAGGHAVTAAGNFTEAMALLDTPRWDVLLTDQMLPGGNGVDLATRAQARGMGVVICSGHPQQLAELAQRRIAHLIKPFSAAKLEAALSAAADDPDASLTKS